MLALLTGCATSTIQSRTQERYAAYQALPFEMREAVDHGAIKAGMPMDAVYIAWGRPSRAMQSGDAAGEMTTWIYADFYTEQSRFWGYRRVYYAYTTRSYVRAEVNFVNGVVRDWHTLGQPVY